MKLIILEKNEKLIAEEGYITQKENNVDNRFFAKEIYAKTLNIDNYREATLEEKTEYENSLLNANRL